MNNPLSYAIISTLVTGNVGYNNYPTEVPVSHPPTNTPEYTQSLVDKAQAKRDRKAKAKQKQL